MLSFQQLDAPRLCLDWTKVSSLLDLGREVPRTENTLGQSQEERFSSHCKHPPSIEPEVREAPLTCSSHLHRAVNLGHLGTVPRQV